MSGWLAIAGLGPGAAGLITPEVTEALTQATDLIGYAPYVARVPEREGLTRHGSDNREELDRASLALRLAAKGKRVVVVSSGDPGVFAMAAAVFEAVEAGDPEVKPPEKDAKPPTPVGAKLEALWNDLASDDEAAAWQIVTAKLPTRGSGN